MNELVTKKQLTISVCSGVPRMGIYITNDDPRLGK
jgi:hypothetical protein